MKATLLAAWYGRGASCRLGSLRPTAVPCSKEGFGLRSRIWEGCTNF
ncbi:MAG: hypothetical protein II431_09490 [Prevotella sp.]|nr:hypothetical protein [Prevotella sp.]